MVPRTSYPPIHHHTSKPIPPSEAQAHLAAFLAQTSSRPYLHPDAVLSAGEIRYPAHAGPGGGLALHHLRRIEAGLRGENLVAETREELQALFAPGDAEAGVGAGRSSAGDDERLDAVIAEKERGMRRRGGSVERVAAWRSSAGGPVDAGGVAASGAPNGEDYMDAGAYAAAQEEVVVEIGGREMADAGRQGVAPPSIKLSEGAERGSPEVQRKVEDEMRLVDKAARKAAKKAKRLQEKKSKQGQKMSSDG